MLTALVQIILVGGTIYLVIVGAAATWNNWVDEMKGKK